MEREIDFNGFPNAGNRFNLAECMASGAYGRVFRANDTQADNKLVAIKIQELNDETNKYVMQEYTVLKDLSNHGNLPDFYGTYTSGQDEIWFVMELCDGGTVLNLVNGLLKKNRRMAEEHIAYILKEVVKALIYLHENQVMHRNLKARNVLLTKEGEVKLTDFGYSCHLCDVLGLTGTCVGSPYWMAPEVVVASESEEYGCRADVWSLGITAVELGDGKAPLQDMHPSRALFQIVRNPPPTLYRPSNWSENYNDFVSECLEKNPDHRPFVMEIIEHPFLMQVPENNYHLSLEIKTLIDNLDRSNGELPYEISVNGKLCKKQFGEDFQRMFVEDLAALEQISETCCLDELKCRFDAGENQTFIGDVLLVINPNEKKDIYGGNYHHKYQNKFQSDNAPHIYAVADSALENALHHELEQKIVLKGESGSGKTFNYLHLIDHFLFLGSNINISTGRIKHGIKLIHSLINASTPINNDSTRAILKTNLTFGSSGKITGAIFKIYQVEKWRVSSVEMFQGNFHIFYYIYDGLKATNKLDQYLLNDDRNYRYLRISNDNTDDESTSKPERNIQENVAKFKEIMKSFEEFQFDEGEINTIFSIVSAILLIGDISFQTSDDDDAVIENEDNVERVATLLQIDTKKLNWALTNYCFLKEGTVVRRKNSADEARNIRDVFANNLYVRLIDFVVNLINHKLSVGRHLFGEKYSVKIFDYYGFECFKRNHLAEFFVNSFNEQIHHHYVQRLFSWENLDITEEEVEYKPFRYYDNKFILNQLMGKPEGVFSFIDEASKMRHNGKYVIDNVKNQESRYIHVSGKSEFSIAHFTGTVTYDSSEMPDKNRDFLSPELIETLRLSENATVKMLFTNKLDKTGNLLMNFENENENALNRRYKLNLKNPDAANQYSQIKRMRTTIAVFRAMSLNILKELSVGSGSGGTHFVMCLRSDLEGKPQNFENEIVRQQLRSMAVMETIKARQRGYPHRIPFPEFLRRYQFLAFDFNENVEISRDNCRLLLIRLKMEGWALGKSKVFLKYYNEEYLARLYETQVKKVIKIQSILRGFLAKCLVNKQMKENGIATMKEVKTEDTSKMSEEEAAAVIQRAFRETTMRKAYNDFSKSYEILDNETCNFIKKFAYKWKNNSLFHVLIMYRAHKFQESFNFSQQVHLYNLNAFHGLQQINESVDLNTIDKEAQFSSWLGEMKLNVLKLPFSLADIPFYDTSEMCDSFTNAGVSVDKVDSWDTPYAWREFIAAKTSDCVCEYKKNEDDLIYFRYTRDPNESIVHLPETSDNEEINKIGDKDEDNETDNEEVNKKNFTKEGKNQENRALQSTVPNTIKHYQGKNKESDGNRLKKRNKMEHDLKINSNTQPANKDFDYIRAPIPAKPKTDPIAELKNMARKSSISSEDDPPFNFQAMLRKTNIRRDSLKKNAETVKSFSFTNKEQQQARSEEKENNTHKAKLEHFKNEKNKNEDYEKWQKENQKHTILTVSQNKVTNCKPEINGERIIKEDRIVGKKIAVELLPGVFIEGIEVDL